MFQTFSNQISCGLITGVEGQAFRVHSSQQCYQPSCRRLGPSDPSTLSLHTGVAGTFLYPGYKYLSDRGSSVGDQLAAWFCQHTARITWRESGRKGRLHDGSIVGSHEDRKLGLCSLRLVVVVAFSSLARILGECSTIHSSTVFFCFVFKWRLACTH